MSSITSVSSSANPYQTDTQNAWQQRVQDFKSLQSALKSGNLSNAQQAFASLQKDMPELAQAANGASSQTSQSSNPFLALQNALSSGNLPAAQQAFSTMQQSMQSAGVGGAGRHHHHHGGSTDSASQTASATSSNTSSQTLSNSLNVLA